MPSSNSHAAQASHEAGVKSARSQTASARNQTNTDFRNLISDAEELLRVTANYSGEALSAARAKFEEHLEQAKDSMSEAGSIAAEKYREAAKTTDRYVHDNPWQAIGIAAAVGILIGFLANRR